MAKLFDRVKVNSTTTGTGSITFGPTSSTAFLTPTEAGAVDGDTVRYVIAEGGDFEEGIGTIFSSGSQMIRTTVTRSKIGGTLGASKMNLSGTAVLIFIASGADILNPANNLSELTNPPSARSNLGLFSAAVRYDTDFPRTDTAQSLNSAQKAQARLNIDAAGVGCTVTPLTSGSGTYTTPSGCKRLAIFAAGAGAPSSGSNGGSRGTVGGNTTFGALIAANAAPLVSGAGYSSGGSGGTIAVNAPAILVAGGQGNGGNPSSASTGNYPLGLAGGGSALFGGGGPGASAASSGGSGVDNTGGGAGAPSADVGLLSGASGGGGGSLHAIINNPDPTYSYAVGAASVGGTAGSSGIAGSPGGSGVLIVVEYY